MGEVRYFRMGRIYAENIAKAMDKLGQGVVSIKPCLVQIRAGFVWYEYVMEVEEGGNRRDENEQTHKSLA